MTIASKTTKGVKPSPTRKYSKYHVDTSTSGKKKRQALDFKSGELIEFDSLLEKRFYEEIIVPGMMDGTILNYCLQKKYQLQSSFKRNGKTIRAIDYVADFWYQLRTGEEKIVDTKGGMVDSVAKLKKKLFYSKYPDLDYEWMTWSKGTGWMEFDEFTKLKRKQKKEKEEN